MSDKKQGIYHSELARLGEVEVEVASDVLPSKVRKGSFFVYLNIDGQSRTYTPENDGCKAFFEGQKGHRMLIRAEGGRDNASISFVKDLEPAPRNQQPTQQQPQHTNGNHAPSNPPPRQEAPAASGGQQPSGQSVQPAAGLPPQRKETVPTEQEAKETAEAKAAYEARQQLAEADPIGDAKRHANKIANVWLIAFKAAVYARKQVSEQFGQEISDGMFQALTSSIYIKLKDDGKHHKLPTGVIDLRNGNKE